MCAASHFNMFRAALVLVPRLKGPLHDEIHSYFAHLFSLQDNLKVPHMTDANVLILFNFAAKRTRERIYCEEQVFRCPTCDPGPTCIASVFSSNNMCMPKSVIQQLVQ